MNRRPLISTKEIVNDRNNIYLILNGIEIWALTRSYLLIKNQDVAINISNLGLYWSVRSLLDIILKCPAQLVLSVSMSRNDSPSASSRSRK